MFQLLFCGSRVYVCWGRDLGVRARNKFDQKPSSSPSLPFRLFLDPASIWSLFPATTGCVFEQAVIQLARQYVPRHGEAACGRGASTLRATSGREVYPPTESHQQNSFTRRFLRDWGRTELTCGVCCGRWRRVPSGSCTTCSHLHPIPVSVCVVLSSWVSPGSFPLQRVCDERMCQVDLRIVS